MDITSFWEVSRLIKKEDTCVLLRPCSEKRQERNKNMIHILIAEDEKAIADLISISLTEAGYVCRVAQDGKTAADLLEQTVFDLVLLDIMLPEINGYELMEYIRPMGIPVIFITAKNAVKDRVMGLRLGAEDYIVKPFAIDELLARVEVVLRRYHKADKLIRVLDVEINTEARIVTQRGRQVDLTLKEFDLLVELARNKNTALFRERLYEKIWGEPYMGESRTLDLHVQRLRRKLGWADHIKTVFRIGYRLEAP